MAAAAEAEAEHEVYYNMIEDRNKFMAYCMIMREGDSFSSDKVAFNWPGEVDVHGKIGNWTPDKLSMAVCYPLVNTDAFSLKILGLSARCTYVGKKVMQLSNLSNPSNHPGNQRQRQWRTLTRTPNSALSR